MGTVDIGHLDYVMRCYLKLDGSFREVPNRLRDLLDYSEKEIREVTFPEIISVDDRKKASAYFKQLKDGDIDEFESELNLIKRSGESIPFFMTGMVARNRNGELENIICHLQNLSRQKEILYKLEEREQQFSSLFKNNPHPVYYFDLEGHFEGVNERLIEFTGYSRKELLTKGFEEFIVEEDLERTKKHFQKAAAGHAGQYEIRVRIKSGEQRDIRVTKFPRYSGGEVIGVFGILQDITDEKRSKRKIERSEQKFKSLFERNPDAVYSFDMNGNFLQANKSLENLTGYDIEELEQLDFEPLVAPEDRERVREKFKKAIEGEPQTYEAAGIHKDGYTYFVQVTNLPIYVDGEITGVFGIAHDITDKKRAQEKISESEKRWEQLIQQNPQPVQIVQDGKIVFINKAGAEYFGADSPAELVGRSILDFTHPDYKKNILKRKNSLENNQTVEPDEHKILLLNGDERYIEAHSIPITYKGDRAIQTVIHDITNLKEKQEVIGKSLKEKEMMLKEIHHRVKNNLSVISSMLELQVMHSKDESAINTLRDSQLRIRSIATIHEKLYQNESLYNINFDNYLKELVQTIQNTYTHRKKNIETLFELDSVQLDINQVIPCSLIINEVIVNCFKHAFNDRLKGELTVSLDYQDPTINLIITDDGKGLPPDFNIDRQESLGMTLIQAFSDQLDGTIDFKSVPQNKGTIFKLRFKRRSGQP